MIRKFASLGAAALLIAMPGMALAHGSTKPQHGGVVTVNGETVFELVRAPSGVSVYLEDEDEPVKAAGLTARLSINSGGERREVEMVPGEGNLFTAADTILPAGSTVGVQVVDNATKARWGTTFIIK